MIRTLAFKEIRESLVVLILATLLLLYFAAVQAGVNFVPYVSTNARTIAFIDPFLVVPFAILIGGFAIALGLNQCWELNRGSSLFLLHRPVARWQLIGTKLAVGLLMLFAVSALPILAVGCWASIPGNQAAPFFWSMTGTAWRAILSVSIIYFSAFLSGIRPARWIGTRILPALGGVALAVLIQIIPFWWLFGLLAVVLLDLLLAETILVTANNRDYA